MAFSFAQLARLAADALADADAELALEQAPAGLDAMDELRFHPLLAGAFAGGGFGVHREQPYPADADPSSLPRDRDRCDLVLTDDPEAPLADPLAMSRLLERAAGTLFGAQAEQDLAEAVFTAPEDACWLEVKVVCQHLATGANPGPNRAYAASLVRGAIKDLTKLSLDARIHEGGSLTVIFAESAEVVEHDAVSLAHACMDAGLRIGEPEVATVRIQDRSGNAVAGVVLIPARLV